MYPIQPGKFSDLSHLNTLQHKEKKRNKFTSQIKTKKHTLNHNNFETSTVAEKKKMPKFLVCLLVRNLDETYMEMWYS